MYLDPASKYQDGTSTPSTTDYFRISTVNQPDAPVSQIYLFWNNTPHVSDGLSVHHQEFKTVHTATGICQTDTATCLLAASR
jgi:hypothetical protein